MPNVGGEDDRITASALVDYVLYWYAMIRFICATVPIFFVDDTPQSVKYTYLCMIIFFLPVLARNYLVMHAIDTAVHRKDNRYFFVVNNDGLFDGLERSFRFLIVFTVISTPKNSYPWASDFVECVSRFISIAYADVYLYFNYAIPHAMSAKSGVHHALPYYSGLCVILFIEFFVWDIVNVMSLSRLKSKETLLDGINLDGPTVGDERYRSYLKYLNVCRELGENFSGKLNFSTRYFESRKLTNAIIEGRIVYLYFTSVKFFERLFGLMSGVMLVICSTMEFSSFSLLLSSVSIIVYAVMVWQNPYFIRSIFFGHIRFPLSYIINGSNPFSRYVAT